MTTHVQVELCMCTIKLFEFVIFVYKILLFKLILPVRVLLKLCLDHIVDSGYVGGGFEAGYYVAFSID